jgi:hypothetical protein
MKPDSDAVTGIAVYHIRFDDDMLTAERDPQGQSCSFWNLYLGAEVQPTEAYILCARYTGRIRAVEMNVHDQTRTVELAALVSRKVIGLIFVSHLV